MSKEQTPIEWLRSELWKYQILEKEDLELFDKAFEKEKEFTQAKVLEALERELIDFHCGCMELGLKKDESVFIKSQWREKVKAVAKEYYETEVKPKYKQINK